MGKVIADISMSLDGFVTGPGADLEHGLGEGGEALHAWVLDSDDPVDHEVLRRGTERSGAVVMGRKLFDTVDGPKGWNDEMGYGAGLVGTPPFFVVTHRPPETTRLDLEFTFVVTGVRSAIELARASAGERDVVVMGGASVVRQALDGGLVDELLLHIAPVVLGDGTALFTGMGRRDLVQVESRASMHATHVTYRMA